MPQLYSDDYWQEKAQEAEEQEHQQAMKAANEIQQIFSTASPKLKHQIEYWLRQMTQDNQLSMAEAMQTLSFEQLIELRHMIEEYMKSNTGVGYEQNQGQSTAAGAMVAVGGMTLFSALMLLVRHIVTEAHNKENSILGKTLEKIYESTRNQTIIDMSGHGVNMNGVPDPKQIINDPWALDGIGYSERIWNNKEKMIQKLEEELRKTLLQGGDINEAIDSMMEFVDESVENARKAAERLVRTESAAMHSRAIKEAYEAAGVKEYIIVAVLDMRTSEICRSLNGKVYKTEWYKVGQTAPPFHPYCRTTTAPYFGDTKIFGKELQRRTTNAPPFDNIELPIQKRTIKKIAKKYGIDISGLTIKIQRGDDMVNAFFSGITDYDHIGRIDLTPRAFEDEEELVRTILHEKCHIGQLKKYGKDYCLNNLDIMEGVAERYEKMWYNIVKKRV